MPITRRELLSGLLGAGVLAHLPVGRLGDGLSAGRASVAFATATADFVVPEVIQSAGGRLAVDLVARARTVRDGTRSRWSLTYNGTTPGPTLVVRPGDFVTLTLVNELDEDTNLHTHGLYVSPTGRADNPFVTVGAGERRTYRYEIGPHQRSATAWYHPHLHGSVARQVSGGLAGAIVVRDDLDTDPVLAGATERVLVLTNPRVGSTAAVLDASMMARMRGREGDVVLVNGVRRPVITAAAGALEYWRIVNASPSRYQRLALDGHELQLIGTDGGRLAAPVPTTELLLVPGARAELLVTPTRTGRFPLRALGYDRGSAEMGGGTGGDMGGGMGGDMGGGGGAVTESAVTLAVLEVTGTAAAAALPASLAVPATLEAGAPTGRRELVFGMGMGGNGGMGGMGGNGGMGAGGGMAFTIDGRTFDASRTDIRTRLGQVEDWTVRNPTAMDHPFHLHVWPFRVVARSDGAPLEPGWRDTVNVPAGGWVTLRVPFDQITGRTVYHCHILDHEDLGMMGVIRVDG